MDIVNKVAQLITDDPNIINENEDAILPRYNVEVNISDELYNNSTAPDYMTEVLRKIVKLHSTFADFYQQLGFVPDGSVFKTKITRNNTNALDRLFAAIMNRVEQVNILNAKYKIYRFQNMKLCNSNDPYKVDPNKICGYNKSDLSFLIHKTNFSSFCSESYSFLQGAIDKIETEKEDEGRYGSMQFENRQR